MIEKALKLLNEDGILSASLLMWKFKLKFENAIDLLTQIVDGYEYVHFKGSQIIYIDGIKMPAHWVEVQKYETLVKFIKGTEEKNRKREKRLVVLAKKIKRKSRWKDVTRP